MIELAFVVCSLLEGQRCRDQRLTFEDSSISLHTCMLYGQMELASWSLDHPNWRVTKWRCQPAGETAAL